MPNNNSEQWKTHIDPDLATDIEQVADRHYASEACGGYTECSCGWPTEEQFNSDESFAAHVIAEYVAAAADGRTPDDWRNPDSRVHSPKGGWPDERIADAMQTVVTGLSRPDAVLAARAALRALKNGRA